MENDSHNAESLRILLILSNYYDPSMPSWPEVMGVFGKEMQKMGHRVDWVMPYRTGTEKEPSIKKYYDADLYLIPFTNNHNIFIEFLSIPIYQFRLLLTLNKMLNNNKYDIILVRDDEISGFTALLIKKLCKIKFVLNYSFPHMLGARNAYDGSIKNALKLAYAKALDILLKFIILPSANFIFPISSRMKDDFISMGIASERMHPLPLGIDTSVFHDIDDYDCREKIKKNKDDFVFIYVGSLDRIRGLDILIDAVKIAITRDSKIKLVFVGNGNGIHNMQKKVLKSKLTDHITFTDRVPFEDVPKYLQCADVALSIISPIDCFRVCSPCKLFEYMAMKKPLIANCEIPEHKEIISSANCGLLVEYSEVSIAEAMIRMSEQKRTDIYEFNNLGMNGHRWVISNRTFKKLADDVEVILKRVVTGYEF